MNHTAEKERLEKRARQLYTLFWVLLIPGSIALEFYLAWNKVIHGIDLAVVPSLFHWTGCIVMGLVFVPILMQTRKCAKAAGAERLYAKATKWYWVFVICTVFGLVSNILGWFFPGLFA